MKEAMPNAVFAHVNLIAADWRKLADFYARTFGCRQKPPGRYLAGRWLDDLTALRNARITGVHLTLPGSGGNGPTLEIFQYGSGKHGGMPAVDEPGFGHIAFAVPDVGEALGRVLENGGSRVGELVDAEIEGVGAIRVVYARDPEGNIIELQKWDGNG